MGQTAGTGLDRWALALGCSIIVASLMYWSDVQPILAIGSIEFTQPDVVVIIFFLIAVAQGLVRGFHGLPRQLGLALLLFYGSLVVSTLVASDHLRAIAAMIQMMEFIILIWCASSICSLKSVYRLLHFIIAVFLFESLLGTWQLFDPDATMPWPHGTFYTNQKYSQFTGVAAAIAYALFASAPPSRKRLVYLLSTIVLLFGMVIGQERAPWLSFLVSGICITYLAGVGAKRKRQIAQFVAALLVVVALVAGVPQLREKVVSRFTEAQVQDVQRNTLLSRLLIWGVAWNLFTEHPVLGVGPKNFVTYTPVLLSIEEMGGLEAADPHNVWLGMLAEGGVIGFAAYIFLCVAILRLAYSKLNSPSWQHLRPFFLAYMAYHLFMFTMSYNYFVKGEGHLHFLMIGLAVGVLRESGDIKSAALVTQAT
jgi:O-antigen ligase